jgi:ABC-2 type transport system ATP-binding protein
VIIQVRDLVKRFGEIEAVSGVDLDVEEGEIFGFLGPNGAGKTTTINVLCTLLKPTSGRAEVAGIDVMERPDEVRSRIGLVFQDPSLDDQLTARENLEFHGFLYGLPVARRRERIDSVLEMVDLTARADSEVMTFSGGMKRRLEIARGIMHFPRVLFLDEPTIGLDPQTRRRIWQYLSNLPKSQGITIFMTTHYMDEAEYCDRIAIIDHGKIVAVGTPAELKAMVGGDIVTITVPDQALAASQIDQQFGLTSQIEDGTLRVEVKDSETFVPMLLRQLDTSIEKLTLSRPTLDDVFLKLTGHAIREEESGDLQRMRQMTQIMRRR